MKKNVIVLLVTAAILTACSGTAEPEQGTLTSANEISENEISANESSSSENEVSENIADAERVSEADSEESTETESTEDAEGKENVSEDDGTHEYLDVSLDFYEERTEIGWFQYDLINLRTTEYPLLEEAVNEYNEILLAEVEYYKEDVDWQYESYISVQRMDSVAVAVKVTTTSYIKGSSRWNTEYDAINLNPQTGEEILLESVIVDMDGMLEALVTELLEKYPDVAPYGGTLEDYISDMQESLIWTLGYEGITFYFGHYDIGCRANGLQEVTLYYDEYPAIYNSCYYDMVVDDYVNSFSTGIFHQSFFVDLNGDNVSEEIYVIRRSNSDCGMYDQIVVCVNENAYSFDTLYCDIDKYYVKAGDEHYLYVERMTEDGCYLVSVFAVTANTIDYVGEFEGELQYFSNSSSFQICRPIDFLGSYNVIMECCVDDTGMPVAIQDRHIIADEVVLTSTAEIEAELIDEDGNLLRTSYVFPAGTRFTLKVTNAESHVEAETSDGRRCILYVNQGTTTMVNGYDATTVFDLE